MSNIQLSNNLVTTFTLRHHITKFPPISPLYDSVLQVSRLKGIPALVTLLRSPSLSVSQAAAGALRNLVFKNPDNKAEVQNCGGIAKALQLLKETDSTETQKQVTGRTFYAEIEH